MRLTQKLFGWIYRAFDRDPGAFLAFRLRGDGTDLAWRVENAVLTTLPTGGTGAPLTVDLSGYNLAELANFLAAQPGYSVLALTNSESSQLSAEILLDASGDMMLSNGDHLYAYSNPNWAYLEANAAELQLAQQQIMAMPAEMATTTADTEWLDLLGSYYSVPRIAGEADAQYGPRIVVEVLRPRNNGIAISMAITEAIGQPATVVDVVEFSPVMPSFNSDFVLDGSQFFNAVAQPIYCLFDVSTGYDLLGGSDPTAFFNLISGMVDRFRSAGTYMRALAIEASEIGDTLAIVPTDSFGALAGIITLADAPATPTDGGALALGIETNFADIVATPNDTVDSLTLEGTYRFDGTRRFDGSWPFMGDCQVLEDMEGNVISTSFLSRLLTEDYSILTTEGGSSLLL